MMCRETFFPHIFDPKFVESSAAEPTNTEGQLCYSLPKNELGTYKRTLNFFSRYSTGFSVSRPVPAVTINHWAPTTICRTGIQLLVGSFALEALHLATLRENQRTHLWTKFWSFLQCHNASTSNRDLEDEVGGTRHRQNYQLRQVQVCHVKRPEETHPTRGCRWAAVAFPARPPSPPPLARFIFTLIISVLLACSPSFFLSKD